MTNISLISQIKSSYIPSQISLKGKQQHREARMCKHANPSTTAASQKYLYPLTKSPQKNKYTNNIERNVEVQKHHHIKQLRFYFLFNKKYKPFMKYNKVVWKRVIYALDSATGLG